MDDGGNLDPTLGEANVNAPRPGQSHPGYAQDVWIGALVTAAAAARPLAVPAAAAVAAPTATALVIPIVAGLARVEYGADPGDRLAASKSQQGICRLLRVLPGRGHPGCDQAGDDGGGERRPAPLGHPLELPVLPDRRLGAHIGSGGEGIDEVLAGRVDIDPLTVVAEVRPIPPVC